MRTASRLADLNPRDVVHIQGIAPRIGGRHEAGLRVGGPKPQGRSPHPGYCVADWRLMRGRPPGQRRAGRGCCSSSLARTSPPSASAGTGSLHPGKSIKFFFFCIQGQRAFRELQYIFSAHTKSLKGVAVKSTFSDSGFFCASIEMQNSLKLFSFDQKSHIFFLYLNKNYVISEKSSIFMVPSGQTRSAQSTIGQAQERTSNG